MAEDWIVVFRARLGLRVRAYVRACVKKKKGESRRWHFQAPALIGSYLRKLTGSFN